MNMVIPNFFADPSMRGSQYGAGGSEPGYQFTRPQVKRRTVISVGMMQLYDLRIAAYVRV
ncbi:hypothetical protein Hanom_Chr02g00141851 [Helianthus anomalus]